MSLRQLWLRISALLGAALLLLTLALPGAPLTDDDDFYIPAGKSYAGWLGRAVRLDLGAFRRSEIDKAFETNHEHPPVAKYALGTAGAVFGGVLGPVSGPRMATVLLTVLTLATMAWMAVLQLGRRRGLWVAALSAGALLLMPRFFFHARVATLDVPVAALYVTTAAFALQAERSPWAAWLLGPVFGLATATKLNAPFFVLPYLFFAFLTRGGSAAVALGPSSGRGLRLPSLPMGLVSMAVLGPLTFFASWPWLWFDTVKRVSEYVSFHLGHYGIYFLYFGRLYEKDPYAPWHMPLVMTAVTVPLVISACALAGAGLGLRPLGARLYWGAAARAEHGKTRARLREGELVLWLILNAAFALAPVMFSGGAKYGGAKLWMPFFPFWALLAGYGVLRLWEEISVEGRPAQLALGVVLALGLGGALGQHYRYRNTPLSQYNALAGGLRGATALGFERQYYDLAFRDLVALLSERAPPNARVHFLPNNWEYIRTFKWYRREGTLRSDVRVTQSEGEAQWIVLTHERRFPRYGADLQRLRGWRVVEERKVDGVPIWTILSRP